MTNQELLQKMKEDMEMRGFSHWTKESYELKAKDVLLILAGISIQMLTGNNGILTRAADAKKQLMKHQQKSKYN